MVRGGSADYVLVVGVEKLSDFTDWDDRGTAFIFGDGAGAAVVGPSDTPGIGPTVWGSDGAQWQAIMQREPWTDYRRPEVGDGPIDKTVQPRNWPAIGMAGQTVFRWAVWGMAPVAQQAIDKAGITTDDLDAFIPHQANMRIIDAMVKQLKLPADIPVARDIAETANTSAASIPLATDADAAPEGDPERRPRPPDRLRRRPRLCRAGRRPPLSLTTRTTLTPARPTEGRTHGAERAGDPRGSGRDRQRGDRHRDRPVELDKSFTDDLDIDSLSMMTIVVNAEEKFGVQASRTTRSRTSRPSATPSASSPRRRADANLTGTPTRGYACPPAVLTRR